MGYNTDFTGELYFTNKLSVNELDILNQFLYSVDVREHAEWDNPAGVTWIELQMVFDCVGKESGIKWNGAEKTYAMDKAIELILREMRKEFPEFGLKGTLIGQGEDIDDRFSIFVDGAEITVLPLGVDADLRVTCPHCGHSFPFNDGLQAQPEKAPNNKA